MNVCVLENGVNVPISTWKGQRVVTYNDIARVHDMTRKNVESAYVRHKNELFEGEDYYNLKGEEARKYMASIGSCKLQEAKKGGIQVVKLFTESGYMILACTFRGEKSAQIRRMLVNSYFKVRELTKENTVFEKKVAIAMNELRNKQIQILGSQNKMQEALEELQKKQEDTSRYIKQLDSYFRITMKNWRQAANYVVNTAYRQDASYSRREYYNEMYSEFEKDTGVRLKTRQKNMQEKSKEKISVLDVIASDKKLIKGFIQVVGAFAMRHHITLQIERDIA